jgi:hypothetical protein
MSGTRNAEGGWTAAERWRESGGKYQLQGRTDGVMLNEDGERRGRRRKKKGMKEIRHMRGVGG